MTTILFALLFLVNFQAFSAAPTTNKLRCQYPNPSLMKEIYVWEKRHLTYYINTDKSFPLLHSEIRSEFNKAIEIWTNNTDLSIVETPTLKDSDIIVYSESIKYPIIGYAYFPSNGDIYFNKDILWTTKTTTDNNEQTIFRWVAAHELGHSLGLDHNMEEKNSIMYPTYSPNVLTLTKNDIRSIQTLYGPNKSAKNNRLCKNMRIDAGFSMSDTTFIIIQNKSYWKFIDGQITSGPHNIHEIFPDTTDDNGESAVDAILSIPKSNRIYVFKNLVYYRFDNMKFVFSKEISKGFPNMPANIVGVIEISDNELYFFTPTEFYIFNRKNTYAKINKKKIANVFQNATTPIDKVFVLNNNIYMTKEGKSYNVFNKDNFELIETGDLATFLNCPQ